MSTILKLEPLIRIGLWRFFHQFFVQQIIQFLASGMVSVRGKQIQFLHHVFSKSPHMCRHVVVLFLFVRWQGSKEIWSR